MNQKNILMLTGLIVFTFISSPAFALDDEWTDYDLCGWNVDNEIMSSEVTETFMSDDTVSKYMN